MANEKAEPLKPQEWERFDKWKVVPGGEADDWGIALEGTPLPFMDKNFYDSGTVWQAGSVASQEAVQPIPSIADVSDHTPNDPSCKACGSAMGWKCASCGSTPEPTQEASGKHRPECNYWLERPNRRIWMYLCGNARKGVS